MTRPMSRPSWWTPLLLLVLGNVGPLVSQVLERPPTTTPTVVSAVASLTASNDQSGNWLFWPSANGATSYWITRVDNSMTNPAEETISKGASTIYTFEGSDCSTTSAFKNCVFVDRTVYNKHFYSYRVWTGGGPSPVASVTVKYGCDRLPRNDPNYCVPPKKGR